jgi:hypothetical protein
VSLKVAGTAVQQKRLLGAVQLSLIPQRRMVMPALLWVVFWSSMMASATFFDGLAEPNAPKDSENAGSD